MPALPAGEFFLDYPQYSFGGDGTGNYGLWLQTTLFNLATGDGTPTVGFLPITGLGQFGVLEYTVLNQFVNSIQEMDVTASADGRVWFQGPINGVVPDPYSYIAPISLLFKSPGDFTENYAGAWRLGFDNWSSAWGISPQISQPNAAGYIYHSSQSIIYDETRAALYSVFAAPSPDYSQNMNLYFTISCDNGMSWSNPLLINNTSFANRGFQSMALDPATGNLVFGWYDGRKTNPESQTAYQTVEYFGAVIPAKKLDNLVNSIPLSNPLFIVTSPPDAPLQVASSEQKIAVEQFTFAKKKRAL